MPSTDYIPRDDEAFRTYAENFSSNITADPAKYMVTPAQAASIQGVTDDFVAKLTISSNEATRTKQTIIDKDDARSVAETMIRQYAIDIKNNEGITDGDKLAIGVRPINPDREPIDPPTTQPLLNVLGNLPGVQTLRYSDSNTPDSAAKLVFRLSRRPLRAQILLWPTLAAEALERTYEGKEPPINQVG